ncbi:MAG: glycosyltransferase involved in cell wall biosynthesis [Granulosicoccus sp.]|jgi:glycosyltransferase involved in cell wall biosynthesis
MSTIAVFHPSAELYGADRILVNALKALPTNVNKRVYLLREGPLVNFLKEGVPNVEVIIRTDMPVIYRAIFNPKGVVQTLINLIGFLVYILKENREHRFSSAYVNTSANVLLLPLLKLVGIKRYIHIHEIIDSPKMIGWLTAFMSRWFANKVVCVSQAVLDGMKRYVTSMEKVGLVLHNGIDPIEVRNTQTSNLKPHISFYLFGRIKPEKGQWFLIEALSTISKEKLRNTKFILMGGVVEGQENVLVELEDKIRGCGLENNVEIRDFSPNIAEAMSDADVCLIPSLMKDPFPTTVLEAMSAAKPVITTIHGGAKEAVIDGETGYLIDPNNTEQLADRIIRLIVNQVKLKEMGEAGSARFNELFTATTFAKSWMKFMTEGGMLENGASNQPSSFSTASASSAD